MGRRGTPVLASLPVCATLRLEEEDGCKGAVHTHQQTDPLALTSMYSEGRLFQTVGFAIPCGHRIPKGA
jgi:hypothetical protein